MNDMTPIQKTLPTRGRVVLREQRRVGAVQHAIHYALTPNPSPRGGREMLAPLKSRINYSEFSQ
jgi:hypothetical protein